MRFRVLIESFGFISDEAGNYADRMMERYENSDEGFPDDVKAELDRLGEWLGRILLLEQPEKVLAIVRKQNAAMLKEQNSERIFVRISTKSHNVTLGTLSRSVFWKGKNFGSASFEFPMLHDDDVWFQDWHLVRDMMDIS